MAPRNEGAGKAACPPTLLRSTSRRTNESGEAGKESEGGKGGQDHHPKLTLQRSVPFRSERPGLERLPTTIDPHHCLRAQGSVASLPGAVSDSYHLREVLGQGAFGVVVRAERRDNKRVFALKTILQSKVEDPALFERELAIARRLKHPYIVRLHETFRDDAAYHLVMDMCTGGDLLERTRSTISGSSSNSSTSAPCRRGGLGSREVVRFTAQMLKGIAYLHNYQFAHRDVKPENYLLESRGSSARLKLIDFGLARSFKGDNGGERRMTSKVGSVSYVAPEVITSKRGYDSKCDIWSIGISVWVMAVASRPFEGKKVSEYIKEVQRRQPMAFDEDVWGDVAEEVRRAVLAMLAVDPSKRPSATEMLRSEAWLKREALPGDEDCCCSLQ